ncbi:MAG TPA: NAD(+)/NADH kinase [Acidimicrobiales bacterium]|nr:NAD(+)/NADH kinase [Acidimicrobiales bacterium]
MSQVIFAAFSHRADAVDLAREALTHLSHEGLDVRIHLLDTDETPPFESDSLVVSLGGDGTFLQAARLAHQFGARVLPVDLGRVGFLLNVPSNELAQSVEAAQRGGEVVDRLALRISASGTELDEFALNEVVVERTSGGHMVRIKTFVDDDEFLTYAADGVLVSTPTGSTGYSFSAGGPVVDAALHVLVITPIAPHFTIDRSIVVGADKVVRLVADERPAEIVADGRVIGSLPPGGFVEVRRSPTPVRVMATSRVELGFRLRESLRAGHA